MKLKILSFSGENYSNDSVISLTVMTKSGEVTILDKHSPIIASIEPCVLYTVYKDENNMTQREDFAVGSGVVEVNNSSVKVLADMLIDVEEVDLDQAELAKTRALEIMEEFKHSKDRVDMEKFIDAQDMLLKSIAQLKLYKMK